MHCLPTRLYILSSSSLLKHSILLLSLSRTLSLALALALALLLSRSLSLTLVLFILFAHSLSLSLTLTLTLSYSLTLSHFLFFLILSLSLTLSLSFYFLSFTLSHTLNLLLFLLKDTQTHVHKKTHTHLRTRYPLSHSLSKIGYSQSERGFVKSVFYPLKSIFIRRKVSKKVCFFLLEFCNRSVNTAVSVFAKVKETSDSISRCINFSFQIRFQFHQRFTNSFFVQKCF